MNQFSIKTSTLLNESLRSHCTCRSSLLMLHWTNSWRCTLKRWCDSVSTDFYKQQLLFFLFVCLKGGRTNMWRRARRERRPSWTAAPAAPRPPADPPAWAESHSGGLLHAAPRCRHSPQQTHPPSRWLSWGRGGGDTENRWLTDWHTESRATRQVGAQPGVDLPQFEQQILSGLGAKHLSPKQTGVVTTDNYSRQTRFHTLADCIKHIQTYRLLRTFLRVLCSPNTDNIRHAAHKHPSGWR